VVVAVVVVAAADDDDTAAADDDGAEEDDDDADDDDDSNDDDADDIAACEVAVAGVVITGFSFEALRDDVKASVCSRRMPSDMYCFSRMFFKQLYNTSTCWSNRSIA